MTAPRMTAADRALLLTLSILWGGSFYFVEVLLVELSPPRVVLLRVSLAAVVLWLLVLATGLPLPRGASTWRDLAVMGLLNNATPFGLITWGQVHVSGGLAAILNATTPLFAGPR